VGKRPACCYHVVDGVADAKSNPPEAMMTNNSIAKLIGFLLSHPYFSFK